MNESVAITGIAFELPGIRSWRDLIASLADKDTYIGELPSLRLQDIQNRYGAIEMAKGGFLPLIDQFDNKYFNVSVREAVKMPPEHRLFLMYALRALYDAGYSEEDVRGSNTGIFYTTARSAYSNYLDEGLSEFDSLYGIEGTRLANFLDLRGPVLSVNTTCSSSLVAVNNAVLSLSAGECDMALVGGVKIATMTKDMADRSTVVSRKQHCKPFDEEADGLMNGEGVICIVLKRLKDAERDGDPVYGVIRGSAVNHGGARISSLTAPSAEAQKEVIVKAWKNAGIRPDEIRFIEAHGTGTILGDPIEFAGIKEAFLEYKLADAPCSISSFKGQVGHLDTLSGLAGLVRLVAAVNAGTLPLQANFDRLNKHINDSDCGIKVQTAAETWEAKGGERIGGVSSFGLTGTNTHMVVSQKEGAAERHQDKDWFYLQIGEDDEERLSRLKQQLQGQLSDLKAAQLGSFCEKMNRVFQLKNRSQGFVFSTIDALRQQLKAQPEAIQQPMFYILDLELLKYKPEEINAILRENKLIKLQWEKHMPFEPGSISDPAILGILFQFAIYKYLIAGLGDKVKFITRKGEGILEQLVYNKIAPAQLINEPRLGCASEAGFDEAAFGKYLEQNNAAGRVIVIDFSGGHADRFSHLKIDLQYIDGRLDDLSRFSLYSSLLKAGVHPLKSGLNPLFKDLGLPYFDLKRFWPETKQLAVNEKKPEPVQSTARLGLNEIKGIVKEVWCAVLETGSIEETDDFFEFGGSSLTALDMLGDLENKIQGIKFSYEEMYDHTTIAALSQAIYDQLAKKNNEPLTEEQKVVDPQLRRGNYATLIAQLDQDAYLRAVPDSILVTGATGSVGAFLVEYLLKHTAARIVCLVRANKEETAYDRFWSVFNKHFGIKDDPRVQVVAGDVMRDDLGLAPGEIVTGIDAIYHAAGSPAFASKFKPHEHINFIGTRNCVDWANANGVQQFNLISTVGVVGKSIPAEIRDFYETDINLGQDTGSLIHASSKILAEEYLQSKFNHQARVFRISNVGGRYQDGFIFSDLSKNLMYLKLKAMYDMGCYSAEIAAYSSGINFVPLDLLANVIAEISFAGVKQLSTYHLNIAKAFSIAEVCTAFQDNGMPFKELDHREFLTHFEVFKQTADNYGLSLWGVGKPQLAGENDFTFHNEATLKLIDNLNIPIVNKYDRLRYLAHVVGFFFNNEIRENEENIVFTNSEK